MTSGKATAPSAVPAAEDRCTHDEVALRRRTYGDGSTAFVEQCQCCGAHVRAVAKDAPVVRALAAYPPDFDHGLAEAYWRGRFERRRQEWERRRDERRAQYDAYLLTDDWRSRRTQRLRLDDFGCQARLPGCAGTATEVHHVDYRHVGNEPLFDLRSVCAPCHRQLTDMERIDANEEGQGVAS